MNGVDQNFKNRDFEKAFPGCLGRMVNLFELNVGVSPNRLLTDKPYREGSPLSRSRSDVSRMSPPGVCTEDKMVNSSTRKSNSTPMKMLIAQEMSKEVDTRVNSPNLVARLMGLDDIPIREKNDSLTQRRGHPRSHSEIPMSYWEQKNGFFHYDPNEYKDVYEISRKSPNKGRHDETTIPDKKMALVRKKFFEAKRLSTDEKLRQSKQFQDALEVLTSNKELFLKCLQEPNSMFSQNLYNLGTIPPLPETKRITVLKPSNNFSGARNKQTGNSPPVSWNSFETPPQPTRIVVLKPNSHNLDSPDSPKSESEILDGEHYFGDVEDDENQESREVAKSVTRKNRDKLNSPRFSNGYGGDESSFSKSEILSDFDATSPVSRHSWDYVNRVESPYSCSSFSRVSYSPESSVCKEAKKRLSERWALMSSSNGNSQEQRHVWRSSSTLGEMLALSESKKVPNDEEAKESNSREIVDNSPIGNSLMNLTRSKSVPVSCTPEAPKEETKGRSGKSSFKGKVSNLFFSRNKKSSKGKLAPSETKDEVRDSGLVNGQNGGDKTEGPNKTGPEHHSHCEASSSNVIGIISPETGFFVEKSIASGNPVENQDQPSPVSVLDPPFEEDEYASTMLPHCAKPSRQGVELPAQPITSNLIDKSPPIGSIARTLSWDDSCSPNKALTAQCTDEQEEEEQDWFFYVRTLLSAAGLLGEVQWNTFISKWNSPESPLDPSLRDKYIDLKDHETPHEAKRRQKRSTRKLVFDCVNAVLLDMAGYGSGQRPVSYDSILDEVWARMNVLFSGDVRCDCGDDSALIVDSVVRKEVVGKGWIGHFRLEMDNLSKEIEGELMDELVQETMVELTK